MSGSFSITTLLAILGFLISLVLAAIRLWEFFTRNTIRLDCTYVFRGSEELDDEIVIANLSDNPALVSYWKLNWKPKKGGDSREENRCYALARRRTVRLHHLT